MPMSTPETLIVEQVQIEGGPFTLEGALAYGEDVCRPRAAVVVACSHPLLGGNLHNNVVRGLGDGLAEQGLLSLRFNYRGVGQSQGPRRDVSRDVARMWETSHVDGEMDLHRDLQAATTFLRATVGPELPLALVGYSFGCALLPLVEPVLRPAAYVLIAPPLARHDYSALAQVRAPVLVIASEDDFATDADSLRAWFAELPKPKRLVLEPMGNHFFRGQEPWLVDTVLTFLEEQGALAS